MLSSNTLHNFLNVKNSCSYLRTQNKEMKFLKLCGEKIIFLFNFKVCIQNEIKGGFLNFPLVSLYSMQCNGHFFPPKKEGR